LSNITDAAFYKQLYDEAHTSFYKVLLSHAQEDSLMHQGASVVARELAQRRNFSSQSPNCLPDSADDLLSPNLPLSQLVT